MAVAITVSFTACQQTGDVDPVTNSAGASARVSTDLTERIAPNQLIDYVRARGTGLADAPAPTVTLTPAQVEAAFNAIDVDTSGQLSDVEILNVLNQNPYGVKVTIAQVQQLIDLFDTNSNGLLEFGEFENLIEDALKRIS